MNIHNDVENVKILLFDIETSPILGWSYGIYESNVIKVERDWHMMSWSAQWFGGKIRTRALPDYERYKDNPYDDSALVKELWSLFNKADIIIGHNGDRFDIKKSHARMILQGLTPPPPNKTIDTLKIARRRFSFTSNKLEDLAGYFGIGSKTKERHGDLWRDCLSGNEEAWRKMKAYNRKDVELLNGIYLKLRGWVSNHPMTTRDIEKCPNCGSDKLVSRGLHVMKSGKYRRYSCKNCGSWTKGKKINNCKCLK